MHRDVAHIAGWMIIVVVALALVGEAYASPTGAFEQWERSRLVRQGGGVGEEPPVAARGGNAGVRGTVDTSSLAPSHARIEYLEDAVWPEDATPLAWEFEGEMIAVDPELPGPEPERELPPDGIWDGRDVEQAAMSGPGWDRRDDGPDRRDR